MDLQELASELNNFDTETFEVRTTLITLKWHSALPVPRPPARPPAAQRRPEPPVNNSNFSLVRHAAEPPSLSDHSRSEPLH